MLRHSVDRLIFEVICTFHWFNPFIHYLKKELILVHECQADHYVIQNGTDKTVYQKTLIDGMFQNGLYQLSNSFYLLIKNRIKMMNINKKSSWKYFIFIPVVCTLFIIFSFTNESENLTKPFMAPVKKTAKINISSPYGNRTHPYTKKENFHRGVDFKAPAGTPVLATANAVVKKTGEDDKQGKFIILIHDHIYSTVYTHLQKIIVSDGQSVKAGDVIGKIGNTGWSTGSHLHYEIWKGEDHVNPADYFEW